MITTCNSYLWSRLVQVKCKNQTIPPSLREHQRQLLLLLHLHILPRLTRYLIIIIKVISSIPHLQSLVYKSDTMVFLMIMKVKWSPFYPHQVFHHHYHLSHPVQSSPADMVLSIYPALILWKSWQSQSPPFFRNLSSHPLSTHPGDNSKKHSSNHLLLFWLHQI